MEQWKTNFRDDVAWAARFAETWMGWADPEPAWCLRGIIAARVRGLSRGEAQSVAFELDEDLWPLVEVWNEAAQTERRHPADPEDAD